MALAVLFDLDETLLDRTGSLIPFLSDQYERFADRLGTASLEHFCSRFLALDGRGQTHKSVVYPALLEEFRGQSDAAIELLTDYRLRCCHHARPFVGMAAVLAELRSKGFKLGIVTNGETDFQTRHISALGLTDLVDAILISQSEGVRKPEREIFARAAHRLGVDPKDCIFVGDNPAADILGAHAAGMKTVWVSHGAEWPTNLPSLPGISIGNLNDLTKHLDQFWQL